MEELIDAIEKRLRRKIVESNTEHPRRSEKHWYTQRGKGRYLRLHFLQETRPQNESCMAVTTLVGRRKFFIDHNLCFNRGRSGHRAERYHKRGCMKCKYKHHTGICDQQERESSSLNEASQVSGPSDVSLTCYTTYAEEKTLPAIIPVIIKGEVLWA